MVTLKNNDVGPARIQFEFESSNSRFGGELKFRIGDSYAWPSDSYH